MPNKSSVRFTIDLPFEQHTYLKMRSASEGKTMKEYIIGKAMKEEVGNKENQLQHSIDRVLTKYEDLMISLKDK